MHCRNNMYKSFLLSKIHKWNIVYTERFLLEVLEEGERLLFLMWVVGLKENENFSKLQEKLVCHPEWTQLFLPSPSFYSWERLTKSTENLGIGRQRLRAIAFLYPACYITDHGIQVTHPSAALSEVECQPLKSACCRTLLAPGANLVAHAGVPWAGSQESIPRHTHAVKSGSVAFPHGLVLHLETRPKNSCWAPALKYF